MRFLCIFQVSVFFHKQAYFCGQSSFCRFVAFSMPFQVCDFYVFLKYAFHMYFQVCVFNVILNLRFLSYFKFAFPMYISSFRFICISINKHILMVLCILVIHWIHMEFVWGCLKFAFCMHCFWYVWVSFVISSLGFICYFNCAFLMLFQVYVSYVISSLRFQCNFKLTFLMLF